MDNLLKQAKQFLSIVETSTLKDEEIKLLISSAILELERSGIDTEYNYSKDDEKYDDLITTAIMFYVKSNFGNVDIKEKEYALRTFNTLEQSLSLSGGYRKKSESL
ncbi:MAG TPA: phage gp6-like head-tail connector protein [Candidatus Onthousia faecavium]|nr:phage gp6-like head-tail connector protein [Candidatus Onthousia faecavium]